MSAWTSTGFPISIVTTGSSSINYIAAVLKPELIFFVLSCGSYIPFAFGWQVYAVDSSINSVYVLRNYTAKDTKSFQEASHHLLVLHNDRHACLHGLLSMHIGCHSRWDIASRKRGVSFALLSY